MDKENEDVWNIVSELVDDYLGQTYNKKEKKNMETQTAQQEVNNGTTNYEGKPLYDSPDQYKAKTSKRYRMTKEQKARNLTRDEAFDEFRMLPENCLPTQGS